MQYKVIIKGTIKGISRALILDVPVLAYEIIKLFMPVFVLILFIGVDALVGVVIKILNGGLKN